MKHFKDMHPICLTFFYLLILIPTMFMTNLYLAGVSLLGGIIWVSILKKQFQIRNIGLLIPMIAVIAIINALVSHEGEQVLFFINNRAITMEALIYGITTGVMLGAGIVWFQAFSIQVDADKIMSLFYLTPKIGLIITMIVRLVPDYIERFKLVSLQDRINYGREGKSAKLFMKRISAVFTWALENSMQKAQVMIYRGIDGRRRMYSPYKYHASDTIFLIVIMALVVTQFLVESQGLRLATMGILCIIPVLIETLEKIRWKFYSSKMHNFHTEKG